MFFWCVRFGHMDRRDPVPGLAEGGDTDQCIQCPEDEPEGSVSVGAEQDVRHPVRRPSNLFIDDLQADAGM